MKIPNCALLFTSTEDIVLSIFLISAVEDLLSVCEYYLGNYKTSLKWSKKALKLDPENTRIINNKELISQKIY